MNASDRLPLGSTYLCTLEVDVGDITSLGGGPYGERRFVPLLGGRVEGPGINGVIVPGGADWQVARADGVLDIDAHYSLLLDDGARVEVRSVGMRHGPAEVLARLGRGEDVDPAEYFFRTVVRFQTGSSRVAHLNRTIAIAVGARRQSLVRLTLHRLT
jgi:Protein of unknown function (DUF3237)